MPADALQAHQQGMVGSVTTEASFQIMLHLRQQMRRHFGIGQRPVGPA